MENSPGTPPPAPAPDGSGAPAPQVVYVQPGQQVVYVQSQPGQPAPPPPVYYQQPVYQQPYAALKPLPPSSGLRIGAGILGIALGFWNIIMFFGMMVDSYGPSTPLVGFLNFFHLIGALATLTLGIMIIVKHRRRSMPIPAMLLGATAWLVIVDIILARASWMPGLSTLTLAGGLPTAALVIVVLVREAAAAKQK